MRYRSATSDDLAAIARLGFAMHAESSFRGMAYDVDCVKETLGDLIDRKQFVVVAEDSAGEVVGGMAGMVTPSWFGTDTMACDLALYLAPEVRGGMVAYRLVKGFVDWARMAGAKQIRPGVITASAEAEALYERMGFMRCGATYLMEV